MSQYVWVVALVVLVTPFGLQAQTCNSQITLTTPASAFTFNSDGTVTNNRSGLVWDRCIWGQTGADCSEGAATGHDWQDALAQAAAANSANYKGHSDWRLPDIKELTSIVERSCYNPAVNSTVFPGVLPTTALWSSSLISGADGTYQAWGLNVGVGFAFDNYSAYHLQVRLVRGGQ